MGATINGIYIPAVNELAWDVAMNAGLTVLANAHITDRKLLLMATEGVSFIGGAASLTGSFPSAIPYFPLTDTGTTGAIWTFRLPSDGATAAIIIRPLWVPSANDGTPHTVRWSADTKKLIAGTDVTTAGNTLTWTGQSSSRNISQLVVEPGSSTAGTFAANDLIRLNLSRLGADAADTFTQNVYLIGVQIDYQNL